MNRRHWIVVASIVFLLFGTAIAASTATSASAPPSSQAQQILEAVRPSVLQVRTLPLGSDSPFSYGTGFAFGSQKEIVTNYHVVSSAIIDPDRYRLEFLRQDGTKGALVVVAIDVAHDLAVVTGETGSLPSLEFEPRVPDKGARGFSVGFPKDQGLTVTEGIINGLSEDSARGAIHYSGAVNGGMSGGPAVNAAGRVIGVNVSSFRGSQLISYLVPAKDAIAIVDRASMKNASVQTDFVADLSQQLLQNAAETLGMFPSGALPVQQFGHFTAPGNPGNFARCWAENERAADKLYRVANYNCRFKDATYVNAGLYLGQWTFGHRHVIAPEMGAIQFASVMEGLLTATDDTNATTRIHKAHWVCQDRIVALSGTRVKAVICLRRYTKFDGLYDLELKIATLEGSSEALLSILTLDGFGYSESMAFIRRFMESISWKP